MSRLVIIGGSKGIGAQVLQQQVGSRQIINISRTPPAIQHANLRHYSADILHDPLPAINDVSTLIYCPGSINLKPIHSLKEADFLEDYRINVLGAVKAIQHFLPVLKKQPSAIVLFSTVAVNQGMPFHSSIAAAKGAIEGLTRSLAAELAPTIRVNCIAPTITETSLADKILRNEKSKENIQNRHPLKRILDAAEVASLAGYLISPFSKSISGQVFGIDAGMSTLRP